VPEGPGGSPQDRLSSKPSRFEEGLADVHAESLVVAAGGAVLQTRHRYRMVTPVLQEGNSRS
jgi:hypothetical protein